MNKTRMGKRAASLLLSLVMMLSLLPTAAYAAMADDVDTQGASVSENGTGVSDDDNSSGDTDDLQVGGSSGSGTADDTTGAEGGADTTGAEGSADPTDSVNGNDSADPQDDGDAVMPVASNVVSTSEELVAAITAANDGDTITLGEGEFTTYGNTSPKKSLTFVGAGDKTVWIIGDLSKDVKSEGNGDCSFDGCETITFQNMTLKSDGADYRGFIRISNTVVKKCTLVGKTAYWGYETAKFEDSTFNAPVGDYALWDYSTKAMTLEGCMFNISGKGVNVYVEQPSTDARTVEVNSCTVNSDKAGKAFLNIKNSTQAFDVTLSGTNTVTGLKADGTTGSALYQVETTEVTETTGNPVTVKAKADDGTVTTLYEVKETVAETTMDLDAFIKAVVASGYNYDGNGVTVKWSPATGCYDTREGHTCTVNNVKATGNTPNRVNAKYAQYQLFSGLTQNVTIKNVKFVYEATAFTVCANSGWAGSGTAANLAEFQFENEGDVKLLDCSFDGVAVAVYNDIETASTVVHGCSFTNITQDGGGYAIHYLKGGKIDVSENTFENVYRGMLVQSTVNKGTNIVNNNFSGIDAANSSCYMVKLLNVKDTDIVISGNTTAANVPVNVNVAYDGAAGAAIAVEDRISTIHTAETDGNSVKISTGGDQMTGYTAPSAAVADASGITVDVDGNVTVTLPAKTTYVAEVNGTEYKTLQAAIDKAGRNATVKLLADTRENVTISTPYLTLDLNGHTLNGGTEKGKPALTVTARVTVKDGSAAKTGTIMREDTAENSGVSSHYVIDIQGAGWLTFESGNVKNNSGTDSGKGASLVRVGDDSVAKYPGLNIKGGTFTQDDFIVIKVDSGDLFLNGGTLNSAHSYAIEDWHRATIKGGTVNGTVAAWTYSGGHNSDLTISGGTVNGNVASVSYDKADGKLAKVSISGGTVDGTLGTYTYGNGLIPINDATKATIAVTGGTFSKDPTKYVVEDSAITPNADGTYGVAKAYLAKVGETSYYTMDEAFKAQTASGEAIVLLRDYTTGSTFNSGTVARTVDLNGHTWTCTGTDANSAAFEINNPNAKLTVKNGKVVSSQLVGLIPSAMGGTIKYDNSSLVFDGVEMTTNARSGIETNGNNTNDTVTLRNSTLNVPNGFGIYFPSSGTLTIDNSVINAKTMGVQVCSGSLNVTGAGTAINVSGDGIPKTINDGAIEDGAAISIVERTGYKGLSEIKVSGGTFTAKGSNDAVKAYKWENQTESDFTQAANVSISGGTFSSAVDKSLCAEGYIPTQNADGTYGVKEGKFVAEVGSTKYETLAEAIAAAQEGQTVTLLADVADCGSLTISKNITLDGSGHTISGNSSISVNMPGNAAADVTIRNVNFKDIANGNKLSAFYFSQVKGKLTITGCTFDSIEYEAIQVTPMEGAEVNVSNNVFRAKADGTQVRHIHIEMAYGSGFDCEGQNIKLTVTDNQLHGTVSGDASMGIWWVGTDSTLKVDGNYVEHPETVSITLANGGVHYNRGDLIYPARSQADVDVDDLMPAVIVADKASGESKIKAYSTLAEAVAAAQDGQTVRLLADVTLDAQIATGKAITIDGQSKYTIKAVKKLVSADNKAGMFYRTQSAKGTLTFLNVTLDGGGFSKIFLNEGGAGETVFDGVTSTNGGGIAYGSGIHISGGGSHATIRNSTLTGSTGTMELNDANYYAANDLWVGGNVYVTVENSVIGTVFVNSAPSATATNGVVHGQLTITGESTKITYLSGEEEAADKLDKFGNNGSLVKIDSGYVEKVFDKGSYAISGGTFKTEVKKEWCAAGYVPTQNGDGTYGVEVGKFTVMVTSRTTGSDSPVANVTGGGSDITYAQGTTVTASAISGYKFVGWFVNEYTGTPYSTDLSCEVKPTDDWTMIAVYEPISGGKFWLTVTASEFTVNGGAVQDSYLYEQFAVGASVTVNFTGSENFLYWVNASNKVVSTEKSYTFIMGSETTLKAVYGKARQNQATVVFISHSDQIISSKAYTTSDTIQFPVPPIKMGCTFTGWSMTEAEIRAAMANNSGIIQVRARYTEPSIACTVTVVYPEGTDNQVVNAVVGKAIDVTAKDIEGKTFSYWTDDKGTVLGYTKTLKLAPSGDMTVKAVYDEAAEAKPVITMSEVSATTANESYVVTFMATRAVPNGYKVVKQGILWSRDAVCGEDGAAAYMQFDSNGKLPTGVNAYIGNSLELNGVTRLDITTKYNDRTFYGRGYMVLESDAGKLVYIYTNTIASGSYDSLTK